MDGRISQYGPYAWLAGPFPFAATAIQRSAKVSVPNVNIPAASIENDVEDWPVEIPDVKKTVSQSDTFVTSIIMLIAFLPITIMTAVVLFLAAKKLYLHVRSLPTWNFMSRLVLIFLFSSAVWAAITPQDWLDRYALVVLLLLTSWCTMKHHVPAGCRRVWNILVYVTPFVLLLLAIWAMKMSRNQVCGRDTCNTMVFSVPVLLLPASLVMRKLWTRVPRLCFRDTIQTAVLLSVLLLLVWVMRKLHMPASCCSISNQCVCFTLIVACLLAPWLAQRLHTQTRYRNLQHFMKWTMLLPRRATTMLSQYSSVPPSPASEEEQMKRDQESQIKHLSALTKLHQVLFQLYRRTSAAAKMRLQNELAQVRRDASATSSRAAAASSRVTAEYDALVAATREAFDPNSIYRNGESIQYIVRRVQQRIAHKQEQLRRKEELLRGSNLMQAVVEEGEDRMTSLQRRHDDEITRLNERATTLQTAMTAKETELDQLAAAKLDAANSYEAEKAELTKTHNDMEATMQRQIDDRDASLKTAQERITASENSAKVAKDDLDAKIQEFNILQTRFDESSATHSDELRSAESYANDLATKLDQVRHEKDESEAENRKQLEAFESKLSDAASAASTQANDQAVEAKRLKRKHRAAIAEKEAEARESLERAKSDMEQVENAHVVAIAAKDQEIQTLQEQVAGLAVRDTSPQQPSTNDIEIASTTEADMKRASDQIATLSRELNSERARAMDLVQRTQSLEAQQQNTVVEGRAAIRALEDQLGRANQQIEELTNTIQSGNQRMGAMDNTVVSSRQIIEDLRHTIQSKNEEMATIKEELLEANIEAECQQDDVKMAKEEKRKAQELSESQQRDLEAQQALVKDLQGVLSQKEHLLKVTATEHNASEYQAVYADLGRAKDLLDEIVVAGCDDNAQMILEGLGIANGTLLKVTMALKEMEEGAENDQVWFGIHKELGDAMIGEHLLSLCVADEKFKHGHPVLLKQAQMVNVRLRRLVKIVEDADATAKKNYVLGVMVLPRGDEGDDDKGQEPDSSSSRVPDGATATKKRRSDGGLCYSRPTQMSFGQQPSTSTRGSGFRLEPDHSFGKYLGR